MHSLRSREYVDVLNKARPGRQRVPATRVLAGLIVLLGLASMACSLGGLAGLGSTRYPKGVYALQPTRTPWPMFTPTATVAPRAVAMVAPPAETVELVPTQIPQPALAPTATPPAAPPVDAPAPAPANPAPGVPPGQDPMAAQAPAASAPVTPPGSGPATSGWSFVSIRPAADQTDEGLLLLGELANATGAAQTAVIISGTFYDAQGGVIADPLGLESYMPVETVPVGGRVPFELVVQGGPAIARFDLSAQSTPANDAPSQDFQFSDVSQWTDEFGLYCVAGQLQNPGPALQEFLTVLLIGYNQQGEVVSFGEHHAALSEAISSNQITDFQTCLDPLNQLVARHELRAFGR